MAGSSISFFNMIEKLIDYGVNIFIIIPDDTELALDFSTKINKLKCQIYKVKIARSSIPPMPYFQIRGFLKWIYNRMTLKYRKKKSMIQIEKICRIVNPDIIHTNTGVVHEGFFVSKKICVPHVWHLREYQDLDFNCSFYPSKQKVFQYYADSYTVSITKDIQEHFKLKGNPKAFTIYNGIMSKNQTMYITPKKKYFLCASQLIASKRIQDAIDAFAIFAKSNHDFELYIAGAGKMEKKLKKHSKNKGNVSKRIRFLGYRNDIPELMSNATALIVTSTNEGFGRMTAEAAFCGCIVIGRNTAGTKEILDNTGGFLYDGTITDLALKMNEAERLGSNEYKLRINKSQNIAINSYTIESNAYKIFGLYNKLLRKNEC